MSDRDPLVSRETSESLEAFAELVRKWSPKINIVSRADLNDLEARHIADSLQLVPLLPADAQHVVDIGSGGGFPGLVLAIHAKHHRPDLRFTLIESDMRKSVFLREAIRQLGLNATVRSERIEASAPAEADVMTARALAPLADLLGHAERHLSDGGRALFLKGRGLDQELDQAQRYWAFDHHIHQSATHPEGAIIEIERIRRV